MRKAIFTLIFLFSLHPLPAQDPVHYPSVDLHGDVRTKWKSNWGETEDHCFKAEATVGCDYRQPQVWVDGKIKTSTCNRCGTQFFLHKALIGYQIYSDEKIAVAIETGRNKMDSMFDSKMQFDNNFDGAHFIIAFKDIKFFDFSIHGGPHIINSSINHYGYVGEAKFTQIFDLPASLKYSFTDWNATRKTFRDNTQYEYAISQVSASYDFEQFIVYGAGLYNHRDSKDNYGFYLGVSMGQIHKAHDWVIDVNYQYTRPNLLSDVDNKGLKKGVEAKVIYALAEKLSVEAKFARLDKNNNNKVELQAIYAW
jgi:hypothetical protein